MQCDDDVVLVWNETLRLSCASAIKRKGGAVEQHRSAVQEAYICMMCAIFLLCQFVFLHLRTTLIVYDMVFIGNEDGRGRKGLIAHIKVIGIVEHTTSMFKLKGKCLKPCRLLILA